MVGVGVAVGVSGVWGGTSKGRDAASEGDTFKGLVEDDDNGKRDEECVSGDDER